MVDSRGGAFSFELDPGPPALLDEVEAPHVAHRLIAGVAAMDYQEGFKEGHQVTVPDSRAGSEAVPDLPGRLVCRLEEVELVEIVVGQTAPSQGPSEDEVHVLNCNCRMGGPVARDLPYVLQSLPPKFGQVADECIVGHGVLVYMAEVLLLSPTAPPNMMALSWRVGVMVWPKRAPGGSPLNSTFSIVIASQIKARGAPRIRHSTSSMPYMHGKY